MILNINITFQIVADSQENCSFISSQQNSPLVTSVQTSPFNKPKKNAPSVQSQLRSTDSEKSLRLPTQHEQPIPMQEQQLDSDRLFTLEPLFPQRQQNQFFRNTQDSLEPSSQQSLAPSEQYRLTEGIQNLGSLNPIETYLFKPTCPEPLFPPQAVEFAHPKGDSDVSDSSPVIKIPRNKNHQRLPSPEPEFYTAPDEVSEALCPMVDSDDSSDFSPEKISSVSKHRKKCARQIDSDLDLSDDAADVPKVVSYKERSFNSRLSNFFVGNRSESDTSDCDKDEDFRFLTPTIFKTVSNFLSF